MPIRHVGKAPQTKTQARAAQRKAALDEATADVLREALARKVIRDAPTRTNWRTGR